MTDKEKEKYIIISSLSGGIITYLISKNLKIGLVGSGITGYYVYNNYEKVKEQIDDTTETETPNDTEPSSILNYISPPIIIGNFIRSIF
jgi:hypothetical protein